MRKKYRRKKLLALLLSVSILISGTPLYALNEKIIKPEEVYYFASEDLQMKALELAIKYDELLTYEKIGESVLNNDIYVLRLTDKKTAYYHNDFARKMDYFVESGTHARETVNPYFVLKMIEDYCIDYYDDDYIQEINMKEILNNSVIHFVPLTNPDGFNLSKYGLSSVDDPMVKKFLEQMDIEDTDIFKSNIRGVDLNRNYEDVYFDIEEDKWVDQFGKNKENLFSTKPSPYHFRGVYPASEPEIQAMQKYMLRYPFRGYISYHSMGEAIYYHKPHFSDSINNQIIYPYAQLASELTGYVVQAGLPKGYGGDGFFSHYGFNNTMKPALTIETTSELYFPIKLEHYADYNKVYLVPAKFMKKAHETGYYDYKVYLNHQFYNDYPVEAYANAVAERLDGQVEIYKGKPRIDNTFYRDEIVSIGENNYIKTKRINYFSWKVEDEYLERVELKEE